jgi:hypothetical protein
MSPTYDPSHQSAAVGADLRALRKGRGINAPDLRLRLGKHLGELLPDLDGKAGDPRQALIIDLSTCAGALPDDLRDAVMASLALSSETRQMPHFDDRVTWLADHLHVGHRTALRRIDDAEHLLAEEIVREIDRRHDRSAEEPRGWYLDELHVIVRLDTPTMEAHERRRIVAIRDGIQDIMAWHDVPRNPDEHRSLLSGEVLYGGRLLRREQPSRQRVQFIVRLPAPLAAGDTHDYELILRVPADEPTRPHYVFTAENRCDLFTLRVRFDPARLPRWVRRVYGETVRTFEAAQADVNASPPDSAGEVNLPVSRPALYLGYGYQWQY